MGFRSVFLTQDYPFRWPAWFAEKYDGDILFSQGDTGAIYAKHERKFWCYWKELVEDIQKAIDWDDFECRSPITPEKILNNFVITFAHECDGITRVHIMRDKIWTTEPTDWEETEGPYSGHSDACSSHCEWAGTQSPFGSHQKFEPPPVQTGSYAEKQMLVQAANVIDALMTMGLTPELRDIAAGVVERVKIMYGDQTTTG